MGAEAGEKIKEKQNTLRLNYTAGPPLTRSFPTRGPRPGNEHPEVETEEQSVKERNHGELYPGDNCKYGNTEMQKHVWMNKGTNDRKREVEKNVTMGKSADERTNLNRRWSIRERLG